MNNRAATSAILARVRGPPRAPVLGIRPHHGSCRCGGIVFILRERSARYPLLELKLVAHPLVSSGLAFKAAAGLATAGLGYMVTLQLQLGWGWTPGSAVRDRAPGVDVLTSLRDMTLRLFDARRPLSAVNDRSIPFFRTVAASPALAARARQIASDLQQTLAEEVERDPTFEGDGTLLAAFFIAGYGTVMVETARRLTAGEPPSAMVDDHRARLERLFDALRSGVVPRP